MCWRIGSTRPRSRPAVSRTKWLRSRGSLDDVPPRRQIETGDAGRLSFHAGAVLGRIGADELDLGHPETDGARRLAHGPATRRSAQTGPREPPVPRGQDSRSGQHAHGRRGRPKPGSLAEVFETLVELQREGLIRHLGVSNVTTGAGRRGPRHRPIVCVQNMYILAHRHDDDLIDSLAADGTAYVPFLQLGGFTPLQSDALSQVAARVGATPMSVALA